MSNEFVDWINQLCLIQDLAAATGKSYELILGQLDNMDGMSFEQAEAYLNGLE